MGKIFKIGITILLIVFACGFAYWQYTPTVDLRQLAVSLSAYPAEDSSADVRTYDLHIKIDGKNCKNLLRTNLITAYLLDSDKFEILPESELIYFYDQETKKQSDPFGYSGGSPNGAYTTFIKSTKNQAIKYDSILMTSKIKYRSEATPEQIEVRIALPKDDDIEEVIMNSDLNNNEDKNIFTYHFMIAPSVI